MKTLFITSNLYFVLNICSHNVSFPIISNIVIHPPQIRELGFPRKPPTLSILLAFHPPLFMWSCPVLFPSFMMQCLTSLPKPVCTEHSSHAMHCTSCIQCILKLLLFKCIYICMSVCPCSTCPLQYALLTVVCSSPQLVEKPPPVVCVKLLKISLLLFVC